jgi:2'-5' RNA ligase
MSMIAVPISEDISNLFRALEVPGDKDFSDHITLFYLGDSINIKTVNKVIPIIFDYLDNLSPFEIEASEISCFPPSKEGIYPIILNIDSNKLKKIRKDLSELFNKAKIDYDKKFKIFKPHLTLSFSEQEIKSFKIKKVSWQVNRISLYCGDNGKSKIYVEFPLDLKTPIAKAANLYKILSDSRTLI